MAKREKLQNQNPPRRVEIRGQDHLLAYITPEEAQMLMDNGGAGKPGPMGIPAFYGAGGGGGTDDPADDMDSGYSSAGQAGDTDTSDAETDDPSTAGAGSTEAGYSDATGQMGTPGADLAGYQGSVGQDFGGYIGGYDYGQKVAALEQLNKDLYDLSRRQERAKSLPSKLGLLAGKNINNIAAALVGYPPDLLSSINPFSDNKIGRGLDPETLAGLQSRGIRGPSGQITGVTDAFGNVTYGNDPNENYDGDGGPEPKVKSLVPLLEEPVEEDIDEDILFKPFEPGAYARMGLLDQAPMGLLQVAGQPYDFDEANRAFRMATATRPEYYSDPYDLTGYTLLV